MRIDIVWASDALTLADVHVRPSWFDRILGRRQIDAPAVLSGNDWLWDVTGKRIRERCVVAALARERRAAAQRYTTTTHR